MDAAEFAGPSSEILLAVRGSLSQRKRGVPFGEDVILSISPGASADKRSRVSTDLTYIRAVRGFDVEWVVLGNDPINNAITERMSSSRLCLLDPLKGGRVLKLPDLASCSAANVGVARVIVAISNGRSSMAVSLPSQNAETHDVPFHGYDFTHATKNYRSDDASRRHERCRKN